MKIILAAAVTLLFVSGAAISLAQTAGDLNTTGLTQYGEKRFQEAINSFDRAMKLDPASMAIRSNLAASCHGYAAQLSGSGNIDLAVEFERRAFELNSANPVIRAQLALYYNNLGRLIAMTGSVSRARTVLAEAIRLQPEKKAFTTNMCTLLIQESREIQKKGDNDQALILLKEAAALDPGSVAVLLALGEFHYGKNDYPASITYMERALSLDQAATNIAARLEQVRKETTVEKGFTGSNRSRFLIRYEDGVNEDLSWNVSGILDDAYREIGQKLQFWPTAPITVIVYSKEQFKAVTSAPDWTIGRFDGKLRIRASDFTLEKDALQNVVRHEYTHALVHDLYGTSLPLWINEGIAQYAASERGLFDQEKALLRRIGEGSLPPPWNSNKSFHSTNQTEVAVAYIESRLFMKYMFERYGNHVTRQFIQENAKSPDLAEITRRMFNMTPEQLRVEWLAELKKQSTP